MGLFDNFPLMTLKGKSLGESMQIMRGGIIYDNREMRSWSQIRSIGIEDGEALQRRITATRLVVLGVFALAAQKTTGGTKFVTVEGDDFLWAMEVDRKQAGQSNRFVMKAKSMRAGAR